MDHVAQRGQGTGRMVVRRAQGRPAARIELEALCRLECCHPGGWRAGLSCLRSASYRGVGLAGRWRGPKVVQQVLGHATAAMTMDLYGHFVDGNLWQAAPA